MAIDPKNYGLIEMAVSFGVVAIFLAQQFWSLRDKPDAKDKADADKPDE